MEWSFNGSQTGRNTNSDSDVSLINSFKMTNDLENVGAPPRWMEGWALTDDGKFLAEVDRSLI